MVAGADAKVFVLEPFDHQHAANYFNRRLGPARAALAMRVFRELRKLDKDFIGRGFVLSLIADFAERSDDDTAIGPDRDSAGTLDWLLKSLCEREQLRQRLPLTGDEQIRVFKTLALEAVGGDRLDTVSVEVAVSEVQPALDAQRLTDTVNRLKQHPLIRWRASDDSWLWQEEQIEVMLLADYLCRLSPEKTEDLARFCENIKLNASRRSDVAAAVVGVALTGKKVGDRELARVARALVATTSLRGGTCRSQEGCALGVAIGLRALDKAMPQGALREERRKKFEYYCGEDAFRGLFVTGTIAAMDFSGVSFRQCYFDQVVWTRCKFDERTAFENCRFVGGDAFNCQGFGLVLLDNTALGPSRAGMDCIHANEGWKKEVCGRGSGFGLARSSG